MKKLLLVFFVTLSLVIFFNCELTVSAEEQMNEMDTVIIEPMRSFSDAVNNIILEEEIIEYLADKYTSNKYQYISARKLSENYLTSVRNVRQTQLNSMYSKKRGFTVVGTHAIVAITLLLDYYNRTGKLGRVFDYSIEDWFTLTMDIAFEHDLTTQLNGPMLSNVDNIITEVFKSLNVKLKGNNDYYYIKSSIRSIYKDDYPIILHIPFHSMVAKGIAKYEVTVKERYWSIYKYKWRTVTKTVEFAVVSEGWGWIYNAYYDVSLIDDIFPNPGPDAMTKIIKK